MDFKKSTGSSGNAESGGDGAGNDGGDSTGKKAPTPKIAEPDPSVDENLNSDGRHAARSKGKRHSRTRSTSRRSWKYPDGPPVPQPNQGPLTLEQCLKVTERDLFKRHEYHKTSLAQKEIYIQYLKFLIETSCRLLYPPGPFPRASALCPTSFGSDFSQFLSDVRYDGNDNIRWIPHRVATPGTDASRDEGKEQPKGGAGANEGTKSGNREHPFTNGNDVGDIEAEESTSQPQESRNSRPGEDQDSAQVGPNRRDTPQPEPKLSPDWTASHKVIVGDGAPCLPAPKGSTKDTNDEGKRITATPPETTPDLPVVLVEDPAFSDSEIQRPTPNGISRRSRVLDLERVGGASRLRSPELKPQGGVLVPHRPKSRGASSSVLPIPYQSNQERLWLKYHEMQLHFDAEIDEMDSRIKALQKHLTRVGGSIDANGVARAGTRASFEGNGGGGERKDDALNAGTTEIGGAWLQDARQTINSLKDMASGLHRVSQPDKSKIVQPAESTILSSATNSTELGTSVGAPGILEMPKATPTAREELDDRTLNELPYEILSAILGCLPRYTQATLSVTCRLWHQIMTPMVWKNVYLDDQVDSMVGHQRATRERKRVAASSDEKEKGKQNPLVQTFWPIACLTVQTSIPANSETDKAKTKDTTDKADEVRPGDDGDWWKKGPRKRARKIPKIENVDAVVTARDRAISYNESLALMPIAMGILRALGNPKLAMHVRTVYAAVGFMKWPTEADQDITLGVDLIRHLQGLRAQTMRQMLVLIKKAVRNLTHVEDLTIRSRDTKISNALLGILGRSPRLAGLHIFNADLRACQLSRGRGKGQAYEVLKRIVEESGDGEEVIQEQIKVIDRMHTENGWMHCPSPAMKAEGNSEMDRAQKSEVQQNGLQETPAIPGAHEKDGTPSPSHNHEKQKGNALDIATNTTKGNEGQTDDDEKPPVTLQPSQEKGKARDNPGTNAIPLTSSEWRQKLSRESMNSACWNPVEMAAYDAGSTQGSSNGGTVDRPLHLAGKRRQPPAHKHSNYSSYFYPSLTHLTIQDCEYHGLRASSTFPNHPKPFPRNAIRATVALRRFLTRCPNLKSLTIRGCTIQAEALFDFGSPRRAVWWKSIFSQTLIETVTFTGGPLFMTEMQCVVEVPFEDDLHSSDGGQQQQQQQQLPAPPSPPSPPSSSSHLPVGEGESASSSASAGGDRAAGQTPETSPPTIETGDDRKRRLIATVWKRLRDNNNKLLTFPNLELLSIDCGTFPRPEVPYRWISSPGFEDFFLRHPKINKLTWDGYILNRHLSPSNPTFLKTAHHLGQTLKTLVLSHVDCQNSPPNQIPPQAAHLKAFSFPQLNAFLRALKTLQEVDIFVDLMPTSQIVGIVHALKGKAITALSLGRAKGVLGPGEVDVLVECLPKVRELVISSWRPKNFIYTLSGVSMDPPGFGELAYEEDEEFATHEEEEEGEAGVWFSVAELATKLSHLPNLTRVSLNYTFPIPLSPPLPSTPNEIFNTICDKAFHDPAALLAISPSSPRSVWVHEYLNSLRATAEVFASTPELRKLAQVGLGYFVDDCKSRGSIRILRDDEGKPEGWECCQLPDFVWMVLDAHELDGVGGSLKPEEGTEAATKK